MDFAFAIAVFTTGAVLVLIGLVGGDLTYRGLHVPKVGVLPRFTTTITGGIFLAIGLGVWAVQMFGAPAPYQPADNGTKLGVATEQRTIAGQQQSYTASSDPSTQPRQSEPVTISISDRLTDGALEEHIDVEVDGQMVGTVAADLDNTSDTLEFATSKGQHTYNLQGVLIAADDGQEYSFAGDGSFDATPGGAFDLAFTQDGVVQLSRRAG
jgi:hypothetical protein